MRSLFPAANVSIRATIALFIYIIVYSNPVQAWSEHLLELTPEETAWLRKNQDKLVLYYNTEFPPIEFADANGEFIGMGADVIALVEQELNITFNKQPCPDWNEHLAALESGECAIAPTIVSTPERQRFAYFTSPYATVPVVLITNRTAHQPNLNQFDGKRVAVVSGFATEEYLRSTYQNGLTLLPVDNVVEGLRSVSFGQADVFAENLAVAAYYIEKEGIPNLKVASVTDYSFAWSIGISREYPLLYSAIQKALEHIPQSELTGVRKKWISLEVPPWLNQELITLFELIAGFVLALVICLTVITYFLKRALNTKVVRLKSTQDELIRQTKRLGMAMEATMAGSWDYNPASGRIYLSDQWFTMLGFPSGNTEPTLEDWHNLVHPDDLPAFKETMESYLHDQDQDVLETEYRMRHADGSYRWVMTKGRSIAWDASDTATRVIGLNIDIQRIHEIQNELASNVNRFKAIFQNAPYPIMISDMETGRLIDANPAFLNRWGLSQEYFSQVNQADLGILDERAVQRVYDSLAKSGISLNNELPIRYRDGESGYALVSAVRMDIIGQRQVLTMTVDVTEAKEAEKILRESEFRFRSFFDSNPEGVILLDFDHRIIDVNRALVKSSGFKVEDLIGRLISDFLPDDDKTRTVQYLNDIRAGIGYELPIETAFTVLGGSHKPIAIKGWRLTDDQSNPVLLGMFIRDLTNERLLEQEKAELEAQLLQSQKMEAIGTLAGGIAHDFNNMLFGILGYSDMALSTVDADTETAGYLREVITAGKRASDLTQQILAFARKSDGKMQAVDVVKLLNEVLGLLSSIIPKSIEIQTDFQAKEAIVIADPSELHQVFVNLCTNASHAMQSTGGVLRLVLEAVEQTGSQASTVSVSDTGPYFVISVSDTGCGIPEDIRERIFEPFFTTKKRGEGTGMGLSVVHGIISQLGGTITLESELGRGSVFRITIPQANMEEEHDIGEESQLFAGREHILVVDDEEALASMLGKMLIQMGYKATVFKDSREALDEIRQNGSTYDLLLTDLAMPHLSGDRLAAQVREIKPNMPIVVCTGYVDEYIEESLRNIGISDRLDKPLDKRNLSTTLRMVLDEAAIHHHDETE